MKKCIVNNCHSVSGNDNGVRLHGFPSSIQLIKLWLQQTGNIFADVDLFAQKVLHSRNAGLYQVCSKHFSSNSYIFNGTAMVLKPDAVPTIFKAVPSTQVVEAIPKDPLHREGEATSRGHSAQPQPRVQAASSLAGHRLKDTTTENPDNDNLREAKPEPTAKVMVDKSIGTDPENDITESKNEKLMNKRLLNLAMEIISLLTGEEYMMVKKNCSLPTEEVPLKCGDVSVYFSMEEWDYIEDHKDMYQKVMMENNERPNERPSSPTSPTEPDVPDEYISTVLVTEEHEDSQSKEEAEQADLSTNTCADEFIDDDDESGGETTEEPYAVNPWETSIVHEDACNDENLQGDAFTMTCSPGESAEDNITRFQVSEVDDSGGNFPTESPRNVMENFVYNATFDQCEDQSWNAYDKFVSDASCISKEHPQIKEESSQYNYTFDEEPAYGDSSMVRACEERGQLFETMNNLLAHQLIHGQSSSVDKPYACNHCDKRFAKRSHLGMHLKTHTGEKPYACPDCGKRFSRRSNMATHYRTHTGEKPFACPKCGKRFTQSSHMVTHQRTHSSDKLFTCPECKKCFTKWSYLNFHLRTHGIEKLSVP